VLLTEINCDRYVNGRLYKVTIIMFLQAPGGLKVLGYWHNYVRSWHY